MNSNKAFRVIQASYDGDVNQLALSPDYQTIAVVDENGEVKTFNSEEGKIQALENSHASAVTAI